MFVFLQESSGLFEQPLNQYFRIEEVNVMSNIKQGRRGPLDLKIGIVEHVYLRNTPVSTAKHANDLLLLFSLKKTSYWRGFQYRH